MTLRVCGLPNFSWDGGIVTGFQKGNFRFIPILLLQSELKLKKKRAREREQTISLSIFGWKFQEDEVNVSDLITVLNNSIPVFKVKKICFLLNFDLLAHLASKLEVLI